MPCRSEQRHVGHRRLVASRQDWPGDVGVDTVGRRRAWHGPRSRAGIRTPAAGRRAGPGGLGGVPMVRPRLGTGNRVRPHGGLPRSHPDGSPTPARWPAASRAESRVEHQSGRQSPADDDGLDELGARAEWSIEFANNLLTGVRGQVLREDIAVPSSLFGRATVAAGRHDQAWASVFLLTPEDQRLRGSITAEAGSFSRATVSARRTATRLSLFELQTRTHLRNGGAATLVARRPAAKARRLRIPTRI